MFNILLEAYRVEKFCAICNEKSSNAEELGKLMTESHESLKILYECSHPQLDKLVTCCLEQGAYGARLTGAGYVLSICSIIIMINIIIIITINLYKLVKLRFENN